MTAAIAKIASNPRISGLGVGVTVGVGVGVGVGIDSRVYVGGGGVRVDSGVGF